METMGMPEEGKMNRADDLLDAIHANTPLSPQERKNLLDKLLRRDERDYPSLQNFLAGPGVTPEMSEEMVQTAIRGNLSEVLVRSMAT